MARILGGDAAAGADAIHEAIALAEGCAASCTTTCGCCRGWCSAPIFLREAGVGRSLIEHASRTARERAAVGALPFVLGLLARDQATTDRWAVAEATYREAIELARESDQRTDLAFGLSGLAWLHARRGRDAGLPRGRHRGAGAVARSSARDSMRCGQRRRSASSSSGSATQRARPSTSSSAAACWHELAITDVDLSPAAELVDAYTRLGRVEEAFRSPPS